MRSKFALWPLVAVLVLGMGCAGVKPVAEQHRSPHFEAVEKKLDVGGTVFLYADMEGDVQRVAEFLDQVVKEVAKELKEEWLGKLDIPRLVGKLGLDGIAATGLSSYKDGKLFRNKSFLRLLGPRKGLMRVAGGAPHVMEVPRLAPQDVDVAIETDMNLEAAYEVIAAIVRDVAGEQAEAWLGKLDQKLPGMEITPKQIIDQLDTRLVILLRIDVENAIRLPFLQFAIPQIDLLVALDNLALLYDVVQDKVKAIPAVEQVKDGNLDLLEVAKPFPGGLQPLLARDNTSKRIYLATSRTLLKEYLDPANGLAGSPAYASATRGFPAKANSISYMGPEMVGKLLGFVDQVSKAYPESQKYIGLVSALFPEPGIAMASVQANLPDGIYSASNTTTSHKSTLVTVLYANPILAGLFMAGMASSMREYETEAQIAGVETEIQRCAAIATAHASGEGKPAPKLPQTLPMVCPTHAKNFVGLDDETSPLSYGQNRAGYETLGWVIKEPAYTCIQFEHTPSADPKSPASFTCHAWSDLDNDDVIAHWSIKGTWNAEESKFQLGKVQRQTVKD